MPRLLALALALGGCTPVAPTLALDVAGNSIVGTWRIAQFTVRTADRPLPEFPYGPEPRGYLVYDATGHVFFQVMRPSAVDSLRLGIERNAPAKDVLGLMAGYAAFFGALRRPQARAVFARSE